MCVFWLLNCNLSNFLLYAKKKNKGFLLPFRTNCWSSTWPQTVLEKIMTATFLKKNWSLETEKVMSGRVLELFLLLFLFFMPWQMRVSLAHAKQCKQGRGTVRCRSLGVSACLPPAACCGYSWHEVASLRHKLCWSRETVNHPSCLWAVAKKRTYDSVKNATALLRNFRKYDELLA